jgi:hypothetical protein
LSRGEIGADDELLLKKLEKKDNLMETLPAAQRP